MTAQHDLFQAPDALPEIIARWFADRGWEVRKHQLGVLKAVRGGSPALLVAPTGGGKTLAGFLPALCDLEARPKPRLRAPLTSASANPLIAKLKEKALQARRSVHTLYISPLKALAVDIARNLENPIKEMKLKARVETRTGDTALHKRQRQKIDPPDLLLTTPEQLALLLASGEAPALFQDLRFVVLDELHVLATSKRGDLLSLNLARLAKIAPSHLRIGLSATVADTEPLLRYLTPQGGQGGKPAALVMGDKGTTPQVSILASQAHVPWSGHMARHAIEEVLSLIRGAGVSLIFVNTRAQAELIFQWLWSANTEALPIALHHGSLSIEQRRRVEAAMAEGSLRAVVCTSTLDLGIDWGAVDLVINIGAPKGSSRLLQRIGRSNHRMNEPSKAVLVPANRFEVLECEAARDAVVAGELDDERPRAGALDVLAQHILGRAVSEPFLADDLYREVTTAAPYAHLTRADFDQTLDFVATGGYALRAYERYAKLRQLPDGRWRITHPMIAQRYRLNIGTIIEQPLLKVRLVRSYRGPKAGVFGGRILGEMEEYFFTQLSVGDTFLFAGHILRFEGLNETEVIVTASKAQEPKIPSYYGGKFPLSTFLASRVRRMIADPKLWKALPAPIVEWLSIQKLRSLLPKENELLVETFPRGNRHYLVCYPFDGRLCHQSLGMLLTRRLERMGLRPMGFVASEYSLSIWGLKDMGGVRLDRLFDEDMLGDDLDAWLAESNLLKRQFRDCAMIAGLIERRFVGQEKTGRQITFNSDLIYDVLRQHQPDHLLLKAAQADAATGLLDLARLGDLLRRVQGRIVHKHLDRVSPLAVPVLLDIGKEQIGQDANEALLSEAEEALIAEATRLD
ncbi:MAG TPA: DNA ligase-associated DEXH box helicase [Alphaproteobacteria bacterium]|nr:DNA ligase-associated DEXH box helicase [Alphaproteobacteria bacterium]HAJ44972.1 DNA ligase-associated DEXH box helicase [Alphaproteobacteria bacterium]